jgi:hypothetical protein
MVATKDELFQGLRKWPTAERRLEFLDKELKKDLPLDVKIAALIARAELYIGKRWPNLGARDYCYAASLATTFKEQYDLWFKGAMTYVLADEYLNADDAFKKVMILALEKDRPALKEKIMQIYFDKAQQHEKERKQAKAITTYLKMLTYNFNYQRKNEIYDRLIKLYEALGNPREASKIRDQKEKAQFQQQQPAQIKTEEKPVNASDFL